MSNEILYTDETKLKDLTVGQLKDIIIETLSHGLFTRTEPERHTYTYNYGYTLPKKPVYPDTMEPYCGIVTDKTV